MNLYLGLFIFLLMCFCIFFGAMLERMSGESKYRTTERIKMSFWSGVAFSSGVSFAIGALVQRFIG